MKELKLVVILILLFVSCTETDKKDKFTNSLSLSEVQNYYTTEFLSAKTKSYVEGLENVNMFYRESYLPEWNTAVFFKTDDVETIDIPVSSNRKYHVLSCGFNGFYLTWCHHSLTVVKSLSAEAVSVYNHFFIPFDDPYVEKGAQHYEGVLYRGFHSNGYRDGFSGLEIYATLSGKVVKYIWYVNGEEEYSIFDGGNIDNRSKIQKLLNYYIVRGYCIIDDFTGSKTYTKASSSYRCPECGHVLTQNEEGFYCCPECGWNEFDFWEQDLDQSTIYGEGGGGTSGGYDDSEFDHQTDPGGGGGNGGGNGGSGDPYSDKSDIPNVFQIAENDTIVRPALLNLLKDCFGESLSQGLSGQIIPFVEEPCSGMIEVVYSIYTTGEYRVNRIRYYAGGRVDEFMVFEELFHCLQILNGTLNKNWRLNSEIEAKYASYLYVRHTNDSTLMKKFESKYESIEPFDKFRCSPSDSAYEALIEVVRNQDKTYASFSESSEHRTMSNIGIFSNCS